MAAGATRVRVGAVDYLNTRPMVHGIEQGRGASRIELSYAVPAVLSDRMAAGELDIGLLPIIELARIPDLELAPGLGIVTFGPARSVLLVSRLPLEEIGSVALDPESRTSNALTQVLFHEVWQRRPSFGTGEADLATTLERFDAAVRIGDKALYEPVPEGCRVVDLGQAWTEQTGKPFVFAAWAARPGVLDREVYEVLHHSRRDGSAAIDRIAADYTWAGRTYPDLSRRYLEENIRYRLGSTEIAAMEQFFAAAARCELIAEPPSIVLGLRRRTECDEIAEQRRAL